jgi:hypothetical protein
MNPLTTVFVCCFVILVLCNFDEISNDEIFSFSLSARLEELIDLYSFRTWILKGFVPYTAICFAVLHSCFAVFKKITPLEH